MTLQIGQTNRLVGGGKLECRRAASDCLRLGAKRQVQLQACESLTFGPLCGERVNHDPGQDIQPAAELNKISAPKAILYQPNGLKSCVET